MVETRENQEKQKNETKNVPLFSLGTVKNHKLSVIKKQLESVRI